MTEVILIDDDSVANFINKTIVESAFNSPVIVFENAVEALEHIRNTPGKEYLIFLDINMPQMDGWQFLEAIAGETDQYKLNIHLLTSSADYSDMQKAKENKLVLSYLLKPLTIEVLQKLKPNLQCDNTVFD